MGYHLITFTPTGSAAKQVSWASVGNVSFIQGGPGFEGASQITRGGIASAVCHGTAEEYSVGMERIRPSRSSDFRTLYSWLLSWWAHAGGGRGEFSFALDSAQASSTLLNGAIAHNAAALVVDSATGFATDHWIYIEDAADRTIWDVRQVLSVAGSTINLRDQVSKPFTDNSVVRHFRYLPKAICLDKAMPLIEKKGGEGVDSWDFKATFRQVR